MKSKKLLLITVIFSILFLTSIFTNNNNNFGQIATKNEYNSNKNDNYNSYPSYSTLDNSDRISFAEKAARWLWTKFQQNKWNESGTDYIELGQSGVSGIGTFYIDLYEKTSNQTYLNWAKSVASWLIQQHPSSYPVGKWPNKIDTANALNYSGWAYGSAGIGSFFVKLYSLTSNNTYLTQAQNVDNYLSSIRKTTPSGKGYVWQEKDPLSLTNEVIWPNKADNKTGTNSTSFSNIKGYDGLTYDINSTFTGSTHKTDVEYWINIFEKIPIEDLYNINQFLKKLTIALSIKSSTGLSTSGIMIYNYGNNSWEPISSSIGPTKTHIEKTYTKDLANYASPIIKIKVNSSSSSAHTISIDALNATIDYNNKYNSSSTATGAAGIGNFYLEFYNATGNNIYLQYATGAANYTLEQAKKVDDKTAWLEYGKYYTGILKGTSGIADFLLEIYNVTHISAYLNEAKNAAKWLVSCNISSLGYSNILIIGETNESTSATYVGAYYLAGIGNFFLKLDKMLPNNWYLNNASLLANWLMTLGQTVERNVGYGYQYLYYKWKDLLNQDDYSYSTGTAGVLMFLNNLNSANNTKKVSEFLSGGIEWIKNTVNLTNASANEYWATSNNLYSVPLGLAGIGLAMINVDIKRPLISIYNVKSSYEYDGDITLYFN
ncbi:MAG: lanthionine synthetase LanC family protein, partial [Candidatus Helarchaeota archaeon]